jgi:hypothetical protein
MYAYNQASEKEAAILGFIAFVVQYKMTGTSTALVYSIPMMHQRDFHWLMKNFICLFSRVDCKGIKA